MFLSLSIDIRALENSGPSDIFSGAGVLVHFLSVNHFQDNISFDKDGGYFPFPSVKKRA
jgi:hypothetical protein